MPFDPHQSESIGNVTFRSPSEYSCMSQRSLYGSEKRSRRFRTICYADDRPAVGDYWLGRSGINTIKGPLTILCPAIAGHLLQPNQASFGPLNQDCKRTATPARKAMLARFFDLGVP